MYARAYMRIGRHAPDLTLTLSESDREFFSTQHSLRVTILYRLATRAKTFGWLVGNHGNK